MYDARVRAARPGRGRLGPRLGRQRPSQRHPANFDDVASGKEAILEFGREVLRLGGAPLAEHGVGRNSVKQRLLEQLYGREGIEDMRAVKRAIDPDWKLAPGVLFPG